MDKPKLPNKTCILRREITVAGNSLDSVIDLVELDRAKPGVTLRDEPRFAIAYYQGGGSEVVLEWTLMVMNENYAKEMQEYEAALNKYRKYLEKVAKEKSIELKNIHKELDDLALL